jgi:hypothetical protein
MYRIVGNLGFLVLGEIVDFSPYEFNFIDF